ncbi:hypothetical protein RWE15_03820 [Virgibacillus halophilus]|uniref:PTS EIIA type-4 domain-containing protein n=1 Tax=Tigheibacillus halophilus TaxID=361280 RepID=A0ABU5C353_9BACI|nr:hypothetical protein [Virgibacillus halophilus]
MQKNVNQYIEYTDIKNGLVILVDMGSLKEIYSKFTKYMKGPVAIINNVSTQMAIFVGNMLERGMYLEQIVEKIKGSNHTEYNIIYPEDHKEKAILTCCFTGMGTAIQLQKLLENSIPSEMEIKVIPYDYQQLEEFSFSDTLFKLFDVLAIVGTANPGVKEIEYISIEDLISGHGEEKIRKVFQKRIKQPGD